MTVHCPYCELTFASRGELDWHVREDHRYGHPAGRLLQASEPRTPRPGVERNDHEPTS